MKKIFFLLFLGLVFSNTTFSQMSLNRNTLNKSAFDLTEKKSDLNKFNLLTSKIVITDEDNSMLINRRRRSNRGRGGSLEGGVYMTIGGGYGLGLGSHNEANFVDFTSDKTSTLLSPTITVDQVYLSLGKGLCINAALGYMINGNFGFEIGMSYLLGGTTTGTNTINVNTLDTVVVDVTTTAFKDETVTSFKATMFRLNPSVIIASGMEGINPYAKFGVTLGFGSFIKEISTTNTHTLTTVTMGNPIPISDTTTIFTANIKEEFTGGMAIGFNATLGCAFTLSDNISLFAEFNMVNMVYSPDKSEVTEATVEGINQLPNYTVMERQTVYSESITTTPATIITTALPKQELKQSFSFGSIGLNIGMKINF